MLLKLILKNYLFVALCKLFWFLRFTLAGLSKRPSRINKFLLITKYLKLVNITYHASYRKSTIEQLSKGKLKFKINGLINQKIFLIKNRNYKQEYL